MNFIKTLKKIAKLKKKIDEGNGCKELCSKTPLVCCRKENHYGGHLAMADGYGYLVAWERRKKIFFNSIWDKK